MSPAQGAHEAAISWGPEKPEWLCPLSGALVESAGRLASLSLSLPSQMVFPLG